MMRPLCPLLAQNIAKTNLTTSHEPGLEKNRGARTVVSLMLVDASTCTSLFKSRCSNPFAFASLFLSVVGSCRTVLLLKK